MIQVFRLGKNKFYNSKNKEIKNGGHVAIIGKIKKMYFIFYVQTKPSLSRGRK